MQRLPSLQRAEVQNQLTERHFRRAAQLLTAAAAQLQLASIPGLHDGPAAGAKLEQHFRKFSAEYIQVCRLAAGGTPRRWAAHAPRARLTDDVLPAGGRDVGTRRRRHRGGGPGGFCTRRLPAAEA